MWQGVVGALAKRSCGKSAFGSAFVGVDVGRRGGRDGRRGQSIHGPFLDPAAVGVGVVHCGLMKASGMGWDIDMRSVVVRLGLVWFGSWR